jgi:hypothetical protein
MGVTMVKIAESIWDHWVTYFLRLGDGVYIVINLSCYAYIVQGFIAKPEIKTKKRRNKVLKPSHRKLTFCK